MNNYPGYNNNNNNQYDPRAYYVNAPSVAAQATLIQRVCYLLCTSLLVTAASAWWAATSGLSPALFLPLVIGTFVCVLAINAVRTQPTIGLILLYVLSVLEGLLMGPLLGMIARNYILGTMIIAESFGITAVIVAGVGTYAWMSSKDFGYLGKTLFWALIGLLIVGFIGIFVNMGQGGYLLYSFIGVAIFTGFVLYDISNIKLRYGPDDYVPATLSLYLDFLNIFWFVLRILLIITGGGGRSRD